MAITTLSNVKTLLGISDTSKDSIINLLIPMIEGQYLKIRNNAFDTDTNGDIVYPDGAELTAVQMIGYQMSNNKSLGVVNEDLADHSIQYEKPNSATNIEGYPMSIVGNIARYKSLVKFV